MATLRTKAVFFPWEKRRGLLGMLQRTRVRAVIGGAVVLGVVLMIRAREERDASVRATRASISTAFFAIQKYRADHSGACPRDLAELPSGGYTRDVPVDAWGRPLRRPFARAVRCGERGGISHWRSFYR